MAPARRAVIAVFPDVQTLDAVGPLEVFNGAGRMVEDAYSIEIAGPSREPLRSSSGLTIIPDRAFSEVRGAIDTLVVAGGAGTLKIADDPAFIAWLGRAAKRSRRVASVCTGSFLLAKAGLLDGRRATTHWASCWKLAERYPEVEVDADAIFVRDGDVWTSAGVTSGMDLALALVEEDLGREVALEIARWLVLFVQRPGGQSQFSAQLSAQRAEREPLREVQGFIAGNLGADLRVEALAGRAHMSPRNFARAFTREVGQTPAAYVEAARVEAACQFLADTAAPIDVVAKRAGFGTPETMRRAFHRRLGIGPAEYRQRFRPALERVA
jgi:transcriptional regulator GlxA family with amidase domain